MRTAALVAEATDLERLQGAWVCCDGKRDALLLIAGSHFLLRFKTNELYVGTLTVDEACYPKHMDMTIEQGSSKHAGKTALCIYQTDDRKLRWCSAYPGRTYRPVDFPQPSAETTLYMT